MIEDGQKQEQGKVAVGSGPVSISTGVLSECLSLKLREDDRVEDPLRGVSNLDSVAIMRWQAYGRIRTNPDQQNHANITGARNVHLVIADAQMNFFSLHRRGNSE
jgi:hypothetical protein